MMLKKTEDLVGQSIGGYRLLEVLGRGGMSVVFLAQQLETSEDHVALKVLLPSAFELPEESTLRQIRFLREAQAASRLHHEHILPVIGYGATDNITYMVMPLITGGTLSQLLERSQEPLPLAEIADYLTQLASAVDYAHEHGLIHRDIKPSNVLRDEQGKVYLTDFGIVHFLSLGTGTTDRAPTSLTATGDIYGTPSYMAPERFKGEPALPATDIYALGILLYQLVTGKVPFKAETPLLLAMRHLEDEPPAPRSLRPDLPEPAEAALLRAIAKRPAERFPTATALAEAFAAGIKGEWVPGLVPSPQDDVADQQTVQQVAPVPGLLIPSAVAAASPAVPNPVFADATTAAIAASPPQGEMIQASPRRRNPLPLLLAGAAAIVATLALAAFLLLPGIQQKFVPSDPTRHVPTTQPGVRPTTTSTIPTSPGGTGPAANPKATPTTKPTAAPTVGVTPPPAPTPTVGVTPPPVPTPTVGVTPPPVPTPEPTTPAVTPTP